MQYDGLFPDHVQQTLPAFGKAAHPTQAKVKFFNPAGIGTWYATEYDNKTRMFFGLCDLGCPELGYFSLDELKDYKGPFGLNIERDMLFDPIDLDDLMEKTNPYK